MVSQSNASRKKVVGRKARKMCQVKNTKQANKLLQNNNIEDKALQDFYKEIHYILMKHIIKDLKTKIINH